MSRASKACDISPAVRREVTARDGGKCIICGTAQGIQLAHYLSRARMGRGIARNLACMCLKCHAEMDNGKYHTAYQNAFKRHLQAKYEDWSESDLRYTKWRNDP